MSGTDDEWIPADPHCPTPGLPPRWLSAWMRDVLGLLWVVIAGIALLVPALSHGLHLGPFDLLSQYGLSKQSGVIAHNGAVGDQIDAIIPWTTLAWTQVHHGQLPLWNPYNGLGLPLAFNWQSAPFGLPALFGYLVPMQYAYTAGVIVTLITAGTGAYMAGRILKLGVLGSATAGTLFELSGPFVGWLGWPHAGVISWIGWIFAAGLLVIRGKRRARSIAFFAVVLALAIYAGQPEILTLLMLALILFVVVLLAQYRALRRMDVDPTSRHGHHHRFNRGRSARGSDLAARPPTYRRIGAQPRQRRTPSSPA